MRERFVEVSVPTAKMPSIQSKRPDRPAIRAPCVTIARQPPWMSAPGVPRPRSTPSPVRSVRDCRRTRTRL